MPSDYPEASDSGPQLSEEGLPPLVVPNLAPHQHASGFKTPPSMQLVPSETWCQIFSLVCTEIIHPLDSLHPEQPLWLLLQVCRHWRNIVESSPGLWKWIRVGYSLFLCAQRPDIITTRLSRMLQYSGQAPLVIDLRIPRSLAHLSVPDSSFKKKDQPKLGSTEFRALMSLLAPEYQRWQRISFGSYGRSFFQEMLFFFQAAGIPKPVFSHLTHFHCHRSENQKGDEPSLSIGDFKPRFPKLQSLWLKEHLEVDQIVSMFRCSQLTDVQLESHRRIHLLLPRFTRAKRIALLQHQGFAIQEDNKVMQSNELAFPRLRELILKYWPKSPGQWPLRLLAPRLTVLKIHTLKDQEDIRAVTSFLHSSSWQIKTLHVQHIVKLGEPAVLRGLLVAIPECTVLKLGFGYDNEDPATRSLFSRDTDTTFRRATRWVESVKTFVAVMREKEQHGPGPLYCPRLERLHIELHIFNGWCAQGYKAVELINLTAFGKMVKSRYRTSRRAASADVSGTVEENTLQGAEGVLREVKLTCDYDIFQHVLQDIEDLEDSALPGLVVDLGAPSSTVIRWV